MKECPRCHNEVNENTHYCPHCGFQLKKSNYFNKSRIILFLSMFIVPFMYYIALGGIDFDSLQQTSNDKIVLEEVADRSPIAIVYEFNTLEDFEKNVDGSSMYVNSIKDFEKGLNDSADKEYYIALLDNYDICFELSYSLSDNDLLVDIYKEYTRSQSVDDLEYTFTQKNIKSLKDIVIDYELIEKYVDITGIEDLYNQLLAREEEFNSKIDYIGHYGFGVYNDNISLVVYPDGDSFKAVFKHKTNGV